MKKHNDQYSQLSIDITQQLSKDEKKEYGIFITPRIIVQKLVDTVLKYSSQNGINIQTILEPSCGTCEIVNYCDNIFNGIHIDAIELNNKIYENIKNLTFKNSVQIINEDFIHSLQLNVDQLTNKYDLIIGNPPYFVLEKGYTIPKQMEPYISGRPNIFGLFIIQAISMLSENGILAFIIPKSFLNSSYYSKIRNYIREKCEIIEIIDFEKDNKFIDTQQSTFGIIIKNGPKEECNYSIKFNDNFMFTNDALYLNSLLEGTTTLKKLGFGVRTGNIVWNQHKDELTDDQNETILLYNTNLTKEHTIELKTFKNDEKHQYIKKDGRIDTILVVNRGNGNSAYKLNYALISNMGPYLIENHLNEIYPIKQIKKQSLIILFNKIIQSFENPKTQQFIDLFLGNNGLSKTELETIFPIYL